MSSSTPYLPDWEWQLLGSDGTYLTGLAAHSRSGTWPVDGPATAQFTLTGAQTDLSTVLSGLVELATDLLVSRKGQALFRGRIVASTEVHDGTGDTVQFSATDYRGLLDHRIIWPGTTDTQFTAEDITSIAWAHIQTMELQEGGFGGPYDLGIRLPAGGGTASGYTATKKYTAGTTIGAAVNELANGAGGSSLEHGFDWEVDVDLLFKTWSPYRGADHGVALVYRHADPGTNIVKLTKTVSPDLFANAIYMTGGKPTTPKVAKTTAVPAGVGRWDQQKSDPNQAMQVGLDDEANGWLTELGFIWDQTFEVVLPAGVWDPATLWVGDSAHITAVVGRLDMTGVTKRVQQIDVALDDDGVEVVTLTLGTRPPKLARRFATIHQRTSKLELEPKTHVLARSTTGTTSGGVSGPASTWFTICSYTPPGDPAHGFVVYRCQVHMHVFTDAQVAVRATYNDIGGAGAQIMTIVPLEALVAGYWSPHSVMLNAVPGDPITIEGYSTDADTSFTGQIESV